MSFLLHALSEEDIFVDVGANLGSYTILACAAIGSRGYAFEPIPKTYGRLVENIKLNDITQKVQAFNKGIGDNENKLFFTNNLDTINHVCLKDKNFNEIPEDSKIEIDVVSLDSFFSEVGHSDAPMFIKIDVEGYETFVIRGLKQTLANQNLYAILIELNGSGLRYGFDESEILETLFDNGFKSFIYDPFSRSLRDLKKQKSDFGNTLFIRDEAFVLDRLRKSPKVSIFGVEF